MIPREVLDAIVPKPPGDFTLPSFIATDIREDEILLKLAIWEYLLLRELEDIMVFPRIVGPGFRGGRMRYMLGEDIACIGIGIIRAQKLYAPNKQFPVVDGYCFGVAPYRLASWDPEQLLPAYLPIGESPNSPLSRYSGEQFEVPFLEQTIDFVNHSHPVGGRSGALVSIGANEFLLTAGHNLSHQPSGASISLNPNRGFTVAPLHVKAPGYIDAALIGPLPMPNCRHTFPVGPRATKRPRLGATIELCLGSARTAATVTQTFRSQKWINVVQPNTFLFDQYGARGDSGAAITSQTGESVGIYLGQTRARDRNGTMAQMGFGLGIDQCLNIFNATLEGALI